jgi:hypothetical protein
MDMEIVALDTLEEALEIMLLPGEWAAARPARDWPVPMLQEKAAASGRTEKGEKTSVGHASCLEEKA